MIAFRAAAGAVAVSLLASACATQPMGPRVAVMPGANKPFEVFQQDEATCRQYASYQVGGQAQQANNQAVGGAVLGTLLGAGLGAAVCGGRHASGASCGSAYTASRCDPGAAGLFSCMDSGRDCHARAGVPDWRCD